jgi:hypothetical protein
MRQGENSSSRGLELFSIAGLQTGCSLLHHCLPGWPCLTLNNVSNCMWSTLSQVHA